MSDFALIILTFIIADNVAFLRGDDQTVPGNTTAGGRYSVGAVYALSTVVALVCVWTVIKNGIVLSAFKVDKLFRIPQNYYIISLVVADLLTAMFSMPLYTQYKLIGNWVLEEWMCDLFLATDWTIRLASLYLRVLITIDKYFTVKYPTKYMLWRTKNKVVGLICSAWFVPAVTFYIYILAWRRSDYDTFQINQSCDMPFTREGLIGFYLSLIYFWPTLILIVTLYACLYKIAHATQKQYELFRRSLSMNCQRHFRGEPGSVNENNSNSLNDILEPRPERSNNVGENPESRSDSNATKQETNVDSPGSTPRFSRRISTRNRDMSTSSIEDGIRDNNRCTDSSDLLNARPNQSVSDNFLDLVPCRLGSDLEISEVLLSSRFIDSACEMKQELDVTEHNSKTESDSNNAEIGNQDFGDQLVLKRRLDRITCLLRCDDSTTHLAVPGCDLKGSEENNLMSDEDTLNTEEINQDDDTLEALSEGSSLPPRRHVKSVPTSLKEKPVPSSPKESPDASYLEPLFTSTPRGPSEIVNSQTEGIVQFGRAHRSSDAPSARYFKSQAEWRRNEGRYPVYLYGVSRKISSRCFPLSGQSTKMAFHAIKAISGLLTAYLCCWLPFQVVVTVNAFWPGTVNDVLYEFTFWLIYLNSFFNPFCYNYVINERGSLWRRLLQCLGKI